MYQRGVAALHYIYLTRKFWKILERQNPSKCLLVWYNIYASEYLIQVLKMSSASYYLTSPLYIIAVQII